MRVHIKRWGNSAAIRLPATVMQDLHLELDAPVEVRAEQGRIVIEPVRSGEPDLGELIVGITDENQHAEVDFGPRRGKEAL